MLSESWGHRNQNHHGLFPLLLGPTSTELPNIENLRSSGNEESFGAEELDLRALTSYSSHCTGMLTYVASDKESGAYLQVSRQFIA